MVDWWSVGSYFSCASLLVSTGIILLKTIRDAFWQVYFSILLTENENSRLGLCSFLPCLDINDEQSHGVLHLHYAIALSRLLDSW